MSHAGLAGILWVVAATVTAFLPMRRQMIPGLALLLAAPMLVAWLWAAHGAWAGGLALAAFLSMFRNPLRYLLARVRGERPEISR